MNAVYNRNERDDGNARCRRNARPRVPKRVTNTGGTKTQRLRVAAAPRRAARLVSAPAPEPLSGLPQRRQHDDRPRFLLPPGPCTTRDPVLRHVVLLVEPVSHSPQPAVHHLVERQRRLPHHLLFRGRVQRYVEQLRRFPGPRPSIPPLQQDVLPVCNDSGALHSTRSPEAAAAIHLLASIDRLSTYTSSGTSPRTRTTDQGTSGTRRAPSPLTEKTLTTSTRHAE